MSTLHHFNFPGLMHSATSDGHQVSANPLVTPLVYGDLADSKLAVGDTPLRIPRPRISSLLIWKTPKQYKAQWCELLDLSIKQTQWSKVCAPMTYTRFSHLILINTLSDRRRKASGDIGQLQPGEIDPDLETKIRKSRSYRYG